MIGKKFQHNHLSYLTCEIVAETRRGYKVLQTETYSGRKKPKTITAYYDLFHFKKGGIWEEITK